MPQTYLPIKNNVLITGMGTVTSGVISVATVIKPVAGRIAKISVVTAGSAAGTVYNSATIAGGVAAKRICTIPQNATLLNVDMFCSDGIVVTPGTGQELCVSYS